MLARIGTWMGSHAATGEASASLASQLLAENGTPIRLENNSPILLETPS